MVMILSNSSPFSLQGLVNTLQVFPVFAYFIGFIKDFLISVMKTGPIPNHIALIMDGNRRYAKRNNLALKDGHTAGAESLISVLDICYRVGVSHITIYAFSIENFNRSQSEVDTLFGLLRDRLQYLSNTQDSYTNINKVRVRIIGNRALIPEDILHDLEIIEANTNTPVANKVLYVCFPYTSRDDIANSIKTTAIQYTSGDLQDKQQINMSVLNDNMYMGPGVPPLDLLVRTSGHTRLSDFMLWQCNYNCTIVFVDTLWPDFKFLAMTSILLKWSYNRTLQLHHESVVGHKEESKPAVNIFKQLPPPPPFASVSQR